MSAVPDEQVTDLNEMRKRLMELARTGGFAYKRVGSSGVPSTIRTCHIMADSMGLSGEDRYTLMAWHLHRAAMTYEKMALEYAALMPPKPMEKPRADQG